MYWQKKKKTEKIEKFLKGGVGKKFAITFRAWVKFMNGNKLKAYVPMFYLEKVGKKVLKNWKVFVKLMERKRAIRKKTMKKYKFFLMRKGILALQKGKFLGDYKKRLEGRVEIFRNDSLLKKSLKSFQDYFKIFGRIIGIRKTIKSKHNFFSSAQYFRLWTKKLFKIQLQKTLCEKVLTSRKKHTVKLLLNAWIRRYNSHCSQRIQSSFSILEFRKHHQLKRFVLIVKKWVKLYKSKEKYRKMKKLSSQLYKHKIFRYYFVGFLITLERGKIKKIKLFKAVKFQENQLEKRFFQKYIAGFNSLLRRRIKKIIAMKTWCKHMYEKTIFSWINLRNIRKNRIESEKIAWEFRKNDLIKEGLSLCISYGLEEKSKREAYIRRAILLENQKKHFLAKKYAKKWIGIFRNQQNKQVFHSNTMNLEMEAEIFQISNKPERKAPKRLNFFEVREKNT